MSFYDAVGVYGWCTEKDGMSQIPKGNNQTWTLATSAVIFLFIASVIAFASPHAGKSKTAFAGSIFAFVGCALTCASFSVATASSYNKSFMENGGGYLPIIQGDGKLSLSGPIEMSWGAGYWCMVIAFICSFISALFICFSARNLDVEIDGKAEGGQDYGANAEYSNETPDPNVPPPAMQYA